jgi:hypothetical protein
MCYSGNSRQSKKKKKETFIFYKKNLHSHNNFVINICLKNIQIFDIPCYFHTKFSFYFTLFFF